MSDLDRVIAITSSDTIQPIEVGHEPTPPPAPPAPIQQLRRRLALLEEIQDYARELVESLSIEPLVLQGRFPVMLSTEIALEDLSDALERYE